MARFAVGFGSRLATYRFTLHSATCHESSTTSYSDKQLFDVISFYVSDSAANYFYGSSSPRNPSSRERGGSRNVQQ